MTLGHDGLTLHIDGGCPVGPMEQSLPPRALVQGSEASDQAVLPVPTALHAL